MKSPEELLAKLAWRGGKVISTAELSALEIAVARAEGRMYVDSANLGFVWVPPESVGKS